MKYAKGQLKTMSNGTGASPFPKSHRASNRMGRSEGNQDNAKITKRPNKKGQK